MLQIAGGWRSLFFYAELGISIRAANDNFRIVASRKFEKRFMCF